LDFAFFFQEQQKLLSKTVLRVKRYLYDQLNWTNRCIAITGQRGVGKTTLMLQYIKENYANSQDVLYISVDNPYFKTISLYEFAIEFEQVGGKILFLDEIHKYKDWSSHIKAIYDNTELQIIFSGSSMLQIYKDDNDLSRRVIHYNLSNLSFREYLKFKGILEYHAVDIEDIFNNHYYIASEIAAFIKPLQYFQSYLKTGCYPFFLEDEATYHYKLINILNQVLESDLLYVSNISFSQIDKIKRLIYLIATSVPFTPNMSKLSQATSISRPTLNDYLYFLELGDIISTLNYPGRGYKKITKPDRIFLNNTNLMYAVSGSPDKGSERETFFVNQLKNYYNNKRTFIDDEKLMLDRKGDFLVENRYIVEIGGKNKSFQQIKDIDNAFVIADDIVIGFKNKIPLWLYGFLY